ncbi:MAG: hypothetical protein K9M80_01875 [Candidatus Marinimicrobia bacterium]|nr:hypothetical protein [Candidatus Neomarinimicrobiota bacterium]
MPSETYKHRVLIYERHWHDGRSEWPRPREISQANYDDASALTTDEALQQMVEMINKSYGSNNLNDRVKAKRAWVITDDDSTDASEVDITIDGTTTTVTSTSVAFDISADINGNATVKDDVISISLGSDKHLIIVTSDKEVSVAASTDITLSDSYVYLEGQDVKAPFDVEVYSDFAEVYDFAFAEIDGSTASTANVNISSTKTSTGAQTVTTITESAVVDLVTAVDAVTELAGVAKSTTIYACTIPETGKSMILRYPIGSTLKRVGVDTSGIGQKPTLDYDDVYKRFAYSDHAGIHTSDMNKYVPKPAQGTEYCQLVYKGFVEDHNAMHGASHTSGYKYTVNIFMPYDDIKNGVDNWLETGDTDNNNYLKDGITGTKDFGEMILFWFGSNPMT